MNTWFARTSEGFNVWFAIKKSNKTLRTGASSGDFTVTIVNAADTASTTASVTESAQKPGLYKFTVPSAFLITHGTGEYGIVVEVDIPVPDTVIDSFSGVLEVSQEDLDSLAVDVAMIPAAVMTETVDVTISVQDALKRVNSWVAGKVVYNTASDILTYYAEDGSTTLFINKKENDTRLPQ